MGHTGTHEMHNVRESEAEGVSNCKSICCESRLAGSCTASKGSPNSNTYQSGPIPSMMRKGFVAWMPSKDMEWGKVG